MKTVLVLGGGMMGRAIARILAKDFAVTVADISPDVRTAFKNTECITTLIADVSDRYITALAKKFDCIVTALPGKIAFSVLKNVIRAGRPIVDISFFDEDPYRLQELARKHRTPLIIDFGIAPGLSNLMLGRPMTLMQVEKFVCYCGGLPEHAGAPWFYKAPFEIASAMDICTRPARMRMNDEIVVQSAMSDYEIVYFDGIGGLEAFATDGLRTLLNLPVPMMIEKTLRHIGFRRIIRPFIDSGFFSEEPIAMHGVLVSPFEITEKLLRKAWALAPEEKEFTALRLLFEGGNSRFVYDLVDRGDRELGMTSMARLVGYTCASMVHAFAEGLVEKPGIIPPEEIGMQSDVANFVLNFLASHGVQFTIRFANTESRA
ncbi:MAG: Saccharopine dehydrogenase-like protein [Parcubacteria group bacterium Gr01-1014_48]|nr:MAG: Saccharopine dehydrogenase-like protein [Parcubacteria group bacterium Gr01-1014_48]